jgi:hypothetical protein
MLSTKIYFFKKQVKHMLPNYVKLSNQMGMGIPQVLEGKRQGPSKTD